MQSLLRIEPRKPTGPLAEWLKDYPPYAAPFPGDPAGITREQAAANLKSLLEQRPARLDLAGKTLARFGIDLEAGLAAPDPNPFFDRIERWALETWPTVGGNDGQWRVQHELLWFARKRLREAFPQVRDEELVSLKRWRNSNRAGGDILYSLLFDISLVLAEVAMRRRPEVHWGLDLTQLTPDDSDAYHVPVLLGLTIPDAVDPTTDCAYAVEHAVFVAFVDMCTSIDPSSHEMTRVLRVMISDYPAVAPPALHLPKQV